MASVVVLLLAGAGVAFLFYVLVQFRLDEKRPRRNSADTRAGEGSSSEPRKFYIVKSRPGHSHSRRGSSPATGMSYKLAGQGLANGVRRQKQYIQEGPRVVGCWM
jgi:hypothetical protein